MYKKIEIVCSLKIHILLGMPGAPKILLDLMLTKLVYLLSTFYFIVVCDFQEGPIKLTHIQ